MEMMDFQAKMDTCKNRPALWRMLRIFAVLLPSLLAAMLAFSTSCVKKEGSKGQVGKVAIEELFKGDPEGLARFKELQKLYEDRKFEEVYKGLAEMIKADPDAAWRPRAELYIGKARLSRKHFDLALKEFIKILTDHPGSPEAWEAQHNIGLVYYQKGNRKRKKEPEKAKANYRRAQEEFQKALDMIPEAEADLASESRMMTGQCKLNLNDKEGAKAAFNKTIDDYPQSKSAESALYRLGGIYTGECRIEEAISAYGRLAEEHSGSKRVKKAKKKIKELELVGTQASEFRVEEWINTDGLSMEQMRGKVVLFIFWATWCPHCRKQMPHMMELYEEYSDQGLIVVGVTKKSKKQDTDKVTDYVEKNDISFPIAIDDGNETSNAYVSTSIPGLAIVDKKGVVRWRAHPAYLDDGLLPLLLAEEG